METRTQIIGYCRQEAHANLQRHIRTGGGSRLDLRPPIAKRYTVHGASRPATVTEILLLAAFAMFRI